MKLHLKYNLILKNLIRRKVIYLLYTFYSKTIYMATRGCGVQFRHRRVDFGNCKGFYMWFVRNRKVAKICPSFSFYLIIRRKTAINFTGFVNPHLHWTRSYYLEVTFYEDTHLLCTEKLDSPFIQAITFWMHPQRSSNIITSLKLTVMLDFYPIDWKMNGLPASSLQQVVTRELHFLLLYIRARQKAWKILIQRSF